MKTMLFALCLIMAFPSVSQIEVPEALRQEVVTLSLLDSLYSSRENYRTFKSYNSDSVDTIVRYRERIKMDHRMIMVDHFFLFAQERITAYQVAVLNTYKTECLAVLMEELGGWVDERKAVFTVDL